MAERKIKTAKELREWAEATIQARKDKGREDKERRLSGEYEKRNYSAKKLIEQRARIERLIAAVMAHYRSTGKKPTNKALSLMLGCSVGRVKEDREVAQKLIEDSPCPLCGAKQPFTI